MAETNSGELMREMNTYLNEATSADSDADGALPFESISDYLGDATGFSDVTAKLWKKVSAVFDLAGKYNRHSPEYLKSLVQLEKGIKFLGSSCLQKHALEMKKYDFPELRQLNTTNLYTMAALHFNKLDRALTEYMDEHQIIDDGLLDMEYRFYNLMERIRATEVKIYNYRDNYYFGKENSNPIIHGLAFSDKSWGKEMHKNDEPMAFQRAKSFSVKSEIKTKSEIGNQKSEISDQCSAKSEIGNQKSKISGQCSGVSGQLPAAGNQQSAADGNKDGRIKNEEFSPKRSSENEGKVREQFSKKKSEIRNQKSEIRSKNEDGRMKKEEKAVADGQESGVGCQVSGVSEQDAAAEKKSLQTPHSSLLTPNYSEAADSSLLTNPEPPEFIKILEWVSMRSRLHNLDYLGFTETEMRQLVADPGFAQFQPEMAAEMRAALEEHDSG